MYWFQKFAARIPDSAGTLYVVWKRDVFTIGHMYLYGLGVAKDYALAMSWEQRAAAAIWVPAYNEIAYMYLNGLGVPKNSTRARAWFQKAADLGNQEAVNDLAQYFHQAPPAPAAAPAQPTPAPQQAAAPGSSQPALDYQHCAVISQQYVQTGNANGIFVQVANSCNFPINIVAVSTGHRTVNSRSANDRGGGIGWNASTMGDAFLYICPSPLLPLDASGNLPTAPNQTMYCTPSSMNTVAAGVQY